MRESYRSRIESLSPALLAGLLGTTVLFGACGEEPAGIAGGAAGATGGTRSDQDGKAGELSTGGTQAGSAGASGNDGAGGESGAGAGTSSGGSGAVDGDAGGRGGGEGGSGGAAATAGNEAGATGGSGGGPDTSCIYHSPPAAVSEGGAPDDAGNTDSGASAADVTIRSSPFVGNYLADAAGQTLYFYGADLPGDCRANNPPISRCTADCALTWPPFSAGARVLAAGLNDAAFGTIERADGNRQTTYYGWPLYRYKDDLTAGQIAGQGKARIWHAAEVRLPTVVIMREGTTRYLADGGGHTLYMSSADQPGDGAADPVSNCSGSCLALFERLSARRLSVVQSLEQEDFSALLNADGSLQLAYRGAPLYRAHADLQAGDMTGTATQSFVAALP
jgi:predicted lipoprotein with Yx(FWY)xxD motif